MTGCEGLEALEGRALLTAFVDDDSPNVLIVFGRIRYDEIVVSVNAQDATRIDVRFKQVVQTFDAGPITQIVVLGRGGDDLIRIDGVNGALAESIIINDGPGDDFVFGGPGRETIRRTLGSDWIEGGGGDDDIHGSVGDTVHGGDGNDVIRSSIATIGSPTLFGDAGSDTLIGTLGRDLLIGGPGNDRLEGWRGHDLLFGGLGNDTVIGWRGRDTLYGEEGDDRVDGGNGPDDVTGGDGTDVIIGGLGDDVFHSSDDGSEITDLDADGYDDSILT
jgi:Ca2+-binding RTX toxin-like protein